MELYINKKEMFDIKNNKDKFDNIYSSDVSFNINKKYNYELLFSGGFSFDNFEAGKKYKLTLNFNFFQYEDFTFYIKDFTSNDVLDSVYVDVFNSTLSFEFTAQTNKIKLDSEIPNTLFIVSDIIIVDDFNNYKVDTDADFNIVYNFNNIEYLESIIVPYSKSFKIYKNEFNKQLFIERSEKIYYDCIILNNNQLVFKGSFIIKNYTNDSYYDCFVITDTNSLKTLTELKIKDYLTEEIDYNSSDYYNYVQNPDSYTKYKYNISKTINEPDFLNHIDKRDYTKFNGNFIDNTSKWNFNSYVRPSISYKYLFDIAHKLGGLNYKLDSSINFDNLVLTNDFYHEYYESTRNHSTTFDKMYDIRYETVGTILYDEDIVIDGGELNTSNGIVDWSTSGLSMYIHYYQSPSRNVYFNITYSLYTANYVGAKDLYIGDLLKNIKVSGNETIITPFEMDIEYHYSRYGYILHINIEFDGGVYYDTEDNEVDFKILDFQTNIDNKYLIYNDNSTIEMKNLVPDDLTFLDVIKNIIKMFNLKIKYDSELKIIEYIYVDNLKKETINLTNKFDYNKYKESFDIFNDKLIYTYYNHTYSDNIYYNNVIDNKLNGNNKILNIDIESNIVYDDFFDSGTYELFYNYPSRYGGGGESDYDGRFSIFTKRNENDFNALGFVGVITGSTLVSLGIGLLSDWNLAASPGYLYFPWISSINFEEKYGLWWNKNEFNNISYYRWWYYSNIDEIESMYDKWYKDYNDHIYRYNPVKFVADFYLTSTEIKDILDYKFVIIDNQRYMVDNMTVSNKKVNLELIKYI